MKARYSQGNRHTKTNSNRERERDNLEETNRGGKTQRARQKQYARKTHREAEKNQNEKRHTQKETQKGKQIRIWRVCVCLGEREMQIDREILRQAESQKENQR